MKNLRFLAGSLITVILFTSGIFAQAIRLTPFIVAGISSPVFMTIEPLGPNRFSGRFFIVQQGGIIRLQDTRRGAPRVFLDITTRVFSGGERGLLGLAFHPDYNTNRRFFVYYTRVGDGAIQIAEYQRNATNPDIADTTEKVIITIPHAAAGNHNGGTVAFGPDGYLYAGPGDGGSANDPPNNAQNINQLLGKIIRIDINNQLPLPAPQYNIPPDNPFAGAIPGSDEIFAVGMRNPYRFSFDSRIGGTGQLWAADVGQGSKEEIDIITNGGNYGWRIMEGTICNPAFNGGVCTPPTGHIPPVHEYSSASPSSRCSITGGYVYRGIAGTFPQGSYVYADYCTGEILLFNGGTETLLLDTTRNIVGFAEDHNGELYVIGQSGTIEKIVANLPFTERGAAIDQD